MSLGQIAIEEIEFNPDSRDAVPAILHGLQAIDRDAELKQRIFELLAQHMLAQPGEPGEGSAETTPQAGIDASTGRLGIRLWNILVLGLFKQAVQCDFDRLHELAHKHLDMRRMLVLSEVATSAAPFSQRTIVRRVNLLTPELLHPVNQ